MSLTINGTTNTLTAASGLTIAGNTAVTGTLSASGVTSVTDTTDATSTTAASLKTAGGLAVAKKAYFGDAITATAVIPLALRRDLQISAVDQSFGLTSYSARYDASNYGIGAYISAVSGSAWSVSNYESYLAFQVTPSASTTPAEALRLSSTALTLATGVQLNLGATGQIKFPATQNASADANTLDDYEEGTWTGAFTFASPGDLVATVTCPGRYTKIGRQVTATFELDSSVFTHTTASSFARLTGLPFAPAFDAYAGAGSWRGITAAGYTDLGIRALASQTYLQFNLSGSGQATVGLAHTHMPTGGTLLLYGTITYFV